MMFVMLLLMLISNKQSTTEGDRNVTCFGLDGNPHGTIDISPKCHGISSRECGLKRVHKVLDKIKYNVLSL